MLLGDSLVFTGSDIPTGHIYAFDKRTGALRWKHFAGLGVGGDIVGGGRFVYALTAEDTLLCLDRGTGETAWSFHRGARRRRRNDSSPDLSGGRIFFRGLDDRIYALDAKNGEVLWNRQMPETLSTSVAVLDGHVYVGSSGGHIYRLSQDDGEIAGVIGVAEAPYGELTAQGPVIVSYTGLPGRGTGLVAVGAGLENILWTRPAGGGRRLTTSRIHVWDDTIIAGDDGGTVTAYRIADGSPQWSATVAGTVKSVGRSGNRLFVGTMEGFLYCFMMNGDLPSAGGVKGR